MKLKVKQRQREKSKKLLCIDVLINHHPQNSKKKFINKWDFKDKATALIYIFFYFLQKLYSIGLK